MNEEYIITHEFLVGEVDRIEKREAYKRGESIIDTIGEEVEKNGDTSFEFNSWLPRQLGCFYFVIAFTQSDLNLLSSKTVEDLPIILQDIDNQLNFNDIGVSEEY